MVKITSRFKKAGIAIYLVMAISLVLVTTTIYGVRLSIGEVSQSSDVARSDQSYYAAEAGIEEALRRLDKYPQADLEDVFPEQYNFSSDLVGDEAILINNDGGKVSNDFNFAINTATESEEIGQLAWRERKVYDSSVPPSGTQFKDESIQLDTIELRRKSVTGEECGVNGNDCDGTPIHSKLSGIEYCWIPNSGNPSVEFTINSFPANNYSTIATHKLLTGPGGSAQSISGIGSLSAVTTANSEHCVTWSVQSSHRYITRIKLNYDDVGNVADHNAYSAKYRVRLVESALSINPLYLPKHTLLIDVVGQSGEIKRRVLAKKERAGRLLGVFDFVVYSGDPVLPLCKAGVQQADVGYNLTNCEVSGGTVNNETSPPPDEVTTQPFVYTGAQQTFTVPAGVTQITVDVRGAAGGIAGGGNGAGGARVVATLSVTPGEVLYLRAGGRGTDGASATSSNHGVNSGGFNGGGSGGKWTDCYSGPCRYWYGSSGGGASDIRRGGTGLNQRIVVAAGGGGSASYASQPGGAGGYNGLNGAGGTYHPTGSLRGDGGGGGSQSGGGNGGYGYFGSGSAGSSGNGGNGAPAFTTNGYNSSAPGGGGGGYYGGGGGGAGYEGADGGGGGGGSSYVLLGAIGVSYTNGYNHGNGQIIITY